MLKLKENTASLEYHTNIMKRKPFAVMTFAAVKS
jgi:hypothetical protein